MRHMGEKGGVSANKRRTTCSGLTPVAITPERAKIPMPTAFFKMLAQMTKMELALVDPTEEPTREEPTREDPTREDPTREDPTRSVHLSDESPGGRELIVSLVPPPRSDLRVRVRVLLISRRDPALAPKGSSGDELLGGNRGALATKLCRGCRAKLCGGCRAAADWC